jgi:hypothetical protein
MAWTKRATKSSEGGGDFERAPAGNHPAVLVALIDMGTQVVEGFQGAPSKEQHRAYMVWELVAEQDSSGKNFLVGHDINISLHEKAKLRKWIEARSGKPIPDGVEYDLSSELGKPCLLNVVEKNGYPKVDGVSGVPKGTTVAKAKHAPVSWELEQYAGSGNIEVPDWIPWLFGRPISEHIMECREIVSGEIEAGKPATAKPPGKPPTSKPPAKTGPGKPPPRKVQAEVLPAKFWVATSDAGEPVLMTKDELKHAFETIEGIDWTEPRVCVDGSDSWLPVFTLVPESSSWSPF